MQRHECSISTSLEKFSMDATDPWSFTQFQSVHHSLCFHKRWWTTVDWRVSNSDCNTPDIQLDSWWISLVQPLKVTGPADLHFVRGISYSPRAFPDRVSTLAAVLAAVSPEAQHGQLVHDRADPAR